MLTGSFATWPLGLITIFSPDGQKKNGPYTLYSSCLLTEENNRGLGFSHHLPEFAHATGTCGK